jgi:hypothetical protein
MELVNQNQVAHQQRGNHGARGDFEGLEQKRAKQKNGDDDGKQTSGPFQPPGLGQERGLGLLHIAVYLLDTLLGEGATALRIVLFELHGGALARGHAIGASGAVLAVRLFYELRLGQGVAAIAGAGGIGAAMVVQKTARLHKNAPVERF